MMRKKLIVISCLTFPALAACGGSSTGASSFESIANEGRALLNTYGTAPTTDIANMPTTGTATYSGAAAYSSDFSTVSSIVAYAETVSDVNLTADFANSTISGAASNFQTIDPNISLNGQINVVNGTISGNQFNAPVSGVVIETGYGYVIPVSYTGTITGEFVGTDANAIRGVGSASGDAGIYGPLPTTYVVWGAERQ